MPTPRNERRLILGLSIGLVIDMRNRTNYHAVVGIAFAATANDNADRGREAKPVPEVKE